MEDLSGLRFSVLNPQSSIIILGGRALSMPLELPRLKITST
jgi:hypothetical protein